MQEELYLKTWYRVFDSVEDLIAGAKTATPNRVDERIRPFHRESFVGRSFSDWAEVYEAARGSWPEGVEVVEQMAGELEKADLPRPQSRRRRPRFDEVDGDEVCYDRLREGRSFWRTSRRQSTRGTQTVTIVVDVNARAKISHRDILWRGAAAIAMTRILEAAGFRVELWTVHKARKAYRNGEGHCTAVCLKRPGDPLDVSTLTAAVSGWFYRSLMFRAKAIGRYKPVEDLGRPCPPNDWDLERITPDLERIVISGTYSYAGALWLARQALERLATPEPPKPVEPEPEPAPAAPVEPPKPLSREERRRIEAQLKAWREQYERENVEVQE